jgi:general secretion pathway protein M
LDQLRGRKPRGGDAAALAARHPGTPFLEGPTVTVAGATLLQRVASAVGNVGGTIQSSQVDVLGTEAKDGFVGLVVSCEMEQPSLQKLLYDLEAGMPFLFVDQLDVQVPQTTALNESGSGRVRVVLGVSGQWQGNK